MGKPPTRVFKLERRVLVWLMVAVTVSGTVAAGTVTGLGSVLAVAIGAMLLLAALGWGLWSAAPDPDDARVNLGTGLLVSVIVAAAVGSAQFAIDDRRTRAEDRRDVLVREATRQHDERVRLASDRQDLRMTIGLQDSLAGADFMNADLKQFFLAGKNLQKARFVDATLVDAVLTGADLSFADLRGANFHRAELLNTDLRFADLRGADLSEANLTGAKLAGADLRGVNVDGATLGAKLAGADLSEVDLGGATLLGATADANTLWPANFNHEMVKTR
jgi:hypothetical protein